MKKGFVILTVIVVILIVIFRIAPDAPDASDKVVALEEEGADIRKTLFGFGSANLDQARIKAITDKNVDGAYKDVGEYIWRLADGTIDSEFIAGNGEDFKTKVFPEYGVDLKLINGLLATEVKFIDKYNPERSINVPTGFKKGSAGLYTYEDELLSLARTVLVWCGPKGLTKNANFKDYVSRKNETIIKLMDAISMRTPNASCLPFELN